jgi:hypothetical protein
VRGGRGEKTARVTGYDLPVESWTWERQMTKIARLPAEALFVRADEFCMEGRTKSAVGKETRLMDASSRKSLLVTHNWGIGWAGWHGVSSSACRQRPELSEICPVSLHERRIRKSRIAARYQRCT